MNANQANFFIQKERYEYVLNRTGISLLLIDAALKVKLDLPPVDGWLTFELVSGTAVLEFDNGDISWLGEEDVLSIPINTFLHPIPH